MNIVNKDKNLTYPPINPKFPFIFHGADYNPDQWPRDTWDEDIRLMKLAKINIVTLPVFSWVNLQPDESTFTFDWLDEIMALLEKNNITVALATPTAAQPAWMSQKYPEMLLSDKFGIRHKHGSRNNFCPTSKDYRKFSFEIALNMVQRYKDAKNIAFWHVSNEYGSYCYCDNCAKEFRNWLKEKYKSLENLNDKWYTTFWSHTFDNWDQITPPYENGETRMQVLYLDYSRFMNQMILDCYLNEAGAIRSVKPDDFVTTNMMSAQYINIDCRAWAKHIDVIAWDCYPQPYHSDIAESAFRHECMRAAKDGQPFLLIEQSPSNKCWSPVLSRKKPGLMRLLSYQALAHGAESVMYFQWRRSLSGCEKMGSAIVESDNAEQTRVFKEVAHLGKELEKMGDSFLGSTSPAQVAILFDWESWWASDFCIGPIADKKYVATAEKHYKGFMQNHVDINVIYPDSNFDKYKIIVAPMLYMLKPGVTEKIEEFVNNGGTFITTTFSGIADEYDRLYTNGFLGPLQKVMGLWVEEVDSLYESQSNSIKFSKAPSGLKENYTCSRLCDTIHTKTAKTLATYGKSWQKGSPVVTENSLGKGKAYYIGTDPEESFLVDFYKMICLNSNIPIILDVPLGVETVTRTGPEAIFIFIINHNDVDVTVELKNDVYKDAINGCDLTGKVKMQPQGVVVLQK